MSKASGQAVATGVWREGLNALLDALVPQACVSCDTWIPGAGDALCGACRGGLEVLASAPACPRCARPRVPFAADSAACRFCQPESFWNLRAIACCGAYSWPLRELIRRHKFAGSERVTRFLAAALVERLRREAWLAEIDVFVPVPMHWLRRWQRPLDHARALAEDVARLLGRPLRCAAVRRKRYAPSQTNAPSRAARFEQVAGCFAAARRPGVEGRTVCVIDNLIVSGATLHEVSKTVRAAGARRVYAAVLARGGLIPRATQIAAPDEHVPKEPAP